MPQKFKIAVTLYLHGRDLNPRKISEATGIEPTKSQARGEKYIISATGREVQKKIGMWSVGCIVDGSDMSAVVEQLFAKIEPITTNVLDLQGVETAKLDIFAVTENTDGRADFNFRLTTEQVLKLAKLNVELEVSLGTFPHTSP